jgi:alanyl-tRNA synthetase
MSKESLVKTKKLYFDDPYRIKFESKVLDRRKHENRPALVLEQTCFYPESGGQPPDKGEINGAQVIDVGEVGNEILHILDKEVLGDVVSGSIDWKTRFDYMQQHAGQHVLSGCFYAFLQGETRSFHLGAEVSTLEINVQKITEAELEKVEELANNIVFQNKDISTYFVSQDKIAEVPLRRPPKKEGTIRVVEVSGFDYSACGGTHPRKTGEIGLIKILKWERIRNNLRFEFVCGGRALRDYTLKNRTLLQAAARLSVGESEVIAALEKLFGDLKNQKKQNRKLREQVTEGEALEMVQKAEGFLIRNTFSERFPDDIRFLASNIIKSPGFVVLFGLEARERVHVVLARSDDVDLDMRELIPVIVPLINGKGGGRPSLVELAGDNVIRLEEALNTAAAFILRLQ